MVKDGLGAFVRRHRLAPVGARRWQGAIARPGRGGPLTVSVTLRMTSGRLEVEVRVSSSSSDEGLAVCLRDHWLGEDGDLIATGDAELDRALAIRVGSRAVLGLFGAETRAALRRVLGSGEVVIDDGELIATYGADGDSLHDADLDGRCEGLVALADALSAPPSTWPGRAVELAHNDVDPGFRAQLAQHLRVDPEHRAALELYNLRRRDDDEHSRERLIATTADRSLEAPTRVSAFLKLLGHMGLPEVVAHARHLKDLWPALGRFGGGEGYDTFLAELATQLPRERLTADREHALELLELLWPHVPRHRAASARTFSGLVRDLGHPGALDMVGLLLDTDDAASFLAALEALTVLTSDPDELATRLGAGGLERLSEEVAGYLNERPVRASDVALLGLALDQTAADPERRAETMALLELLAERGGGDAEELILGALGHHDDVVVHKAIALLGAVGGRRSQVALAPLTGGLFRASETKELARASLAAIAERMGAPPSGGLSLSDDKTGGLSLGE